MKGIWDEILGLDNVNLNKERVIPKGEPNTPGTGPNIEQFLNMRLSELAKRNIALKIYSEILGCEIWLGSNEEMANRLRQDDFGAITYTVEELRSLYRLKPSPEELITIHSAKTVFDGPRIVDSTLKETSDEPDRT